LLVFFTNSELISSYSAKAKANNVEHKDKVPKDSTAKVQLESLDENTVYYEDFNSGPSVKKKQ
jgi:hypothetical protein